MITEAAFYIMDVKIGPYAYGQIGIWDEGKYIDVDDPSWDGRKPVDAYAPLTRGDPLPDFLSTLGYECLSERTHSLFVQHLQIWSGFAWVKVRALNSRGRHVADYWWPKYKGLVALDVLDMTHAKYTLVPPEGLVAPGSIMVQNVLRWVLHGPIVDGLDFLRGHNVSTFASPKARDLILTHKLTGFEFEPVAVWRPDC